MGKAVVKKDEPRGITETASAELDIAGSEARQETEIQAAVVLAKRFPRDENKVFERIKAACSRASFAEGASYSFPRGGASVIGPSVHLAREMARSFGNIRYGIDILRDDDESRSIRAWAWDIEANAFHTQPDTFKKLIYRIDKKTGAGRWIVPDERDLRELTNRRAAICLRNAILAIMPAMWAEDLLAICAGTLQASAQKNKPGTVEKMLRTFASLSGVSKDQIEEFLGHSIEDVTSEELTTLRGIYESIKDGVAKKEEYFRTQGEIEKASSSGLKVADIKKPDEKSEGETPSLKEKLQKEAAPNG